MAYHAGLAPSPGTRRFSRQWPQVFKDGGKPLELYPWMRALRESALRERSGRHDGIELFMRRYDDGRTPYRVKAVIDYCTGFGEEQFRDTKTMSQGNAWLDDRPAPLAPVSVGRRNTSASNALSLRQTNVECDVTDAHVQHPLAASQDTVLTARSYDEYLTAWDLRRHLHVSRFDHDRFEDADRRLIHIADPSPCHMLALTETATEHQAPAIENLLGQYLTFRTSMKVRISTGGYPVFQLEHHFPYFGLYTKSLDNVGKPGSKRADRQILVDLSFLDPSNEPGAYGIYQARSYFTLSGSDNTHWVAYDLEDTSFDSDRAIGDDECNEFWRSDQISMGKFDANLPFYDAREYFLAISLIKADHARNEIERIVGQIEASFRHHMTCHPFSTASAAEQSAISKWNEPMLELLAMLIQDIRTKVNRWDGFKCKHLDYFDDPNATLPLRVVEHIEHTINRLEDVYDELKEYEETLSSIQQSCKELGDRLDRRLSFKGGKIGEFTVVIISPVVIVSGMFATTTSVLPYKQDSTSFFLSVAAVAFLLWLSLLLKGDWLGQQGWWERLLRKGRTARKRRDSSIVVVKEGEPSRLRRRDTHANSSSGGE